MPHSSGGGSHSSGSYSYSGSSGGGSHSSGYHSSSSGSSYSGSSYSGSSYSSRRYDPAPSVSSSSFSGANRYVYYRNKKPHYVYSDYKARKRISVWRLIIYTLLIIVALDNLLYPDNRPVKLTGSHDRSIVIEDSLGCLGDTMELEGTLSAFMEETGIVPAVIAAPNEKWQGYYKALTNYAYDLYVNRFRDEKHWLIVYTQPAEPDPKFVDWYWEGMQGDDTDKILRPEVTEVFGKELQKCLTASSIYTINEAIVSAFRAIDPITMGNRPDTTYETIASVLLLIGLIVLALFRTRLIQSTAQRPKGLPEDAVRCTTAEPTIKCAYCGSLYYKTMLRCPACGAGRK